MSITKCSTFDPRDMFLCQQIGFSFVRTAMASEILERTSGFVPPSETTTQRYLNLITIPSFRPVALMSLWMSLALYVINLVFSAVISIIYLVQVLSRLYTRAATLFVSYSIFVIGKLQIGNISASYANLSIIFL